MKDRKELSTSAVIVAAGKGTRMNMDENKQYIPVRNKPVLARTLQAFEECRYIDEVIVVVNPLEIVYCKQHIVDAFGFSKIRKLVSGGDTRQGSVYHGLKEVNVGCDIVVIHDGARPFVSEKSIAASIHAAYAYGASSVAVPVKDTVKKADKEGFVDQTLERSELWAVQTPQAFRYDLVLQAHEAARKGGYSGTDDAMLVEKLGHQLKLVTGDYFNIKITTREDLVHAEAIAAQMDE